MVFGIWLAVLGILGASHLIIKKKPNAKELIAKMAPYQGWIGAISAIWGAWGIISAILNITPVFTNAPVWWITWLACAVVLFALGLLLGVGVFKTFIKNPAANEKMDQTIARVAPFQDILGLVGIGLGIWTIIACLQV
jgi:hypothetical protein